MPSPTCNFEWPVDAIEADLIPAYARPRHRCDEPADHTERTLEHRLDAAGHPVRVAVHHRCHCSAWHPATDPAGAQL